MAHYGPETLTVLRTVLDEAWATLSDGSKSETLKSEMAQHILQQAARGERDPVILRVSVLGLVETSASGVKAPLKRRRTIHNATFAERMANEAQRLEEQAHRMAPGKDREMILRKLRQTKTAAHINEWLSSPVPPK